MNPPLHLQQLATFLADSDPTSCRVVTGFDGFVDEMITLVDERRSLDDFTAVPDIATFGDMIRASAGHSSLREIEVHAVHPGGCAVNLADGIASLGAVVDCFATLGQPMHPAFAEITKKFHSCHTWGREPGRTLAFEFNDGKLMFSAVKQLAEFTPGSVRKHLAGGEFQKACAASKVIALTNWTLYPHMTDVWSMLQTEVFANLKHRPNFFIDLVDPSGRCSSDIRRMASMLYAFEDTGPLTLGLNGKEANILCRLHGLSELHAEADPQEVLQQAVLLRDTLSISRVIVHRLAFAVCASAVGQFLQTVPICSNPKKSTGAGDRFNAGCCLGLALGLGAQDMLALGCATAGYFVRNARSANQAELVEFIRFGWREPMLVSTRSDNECASLDGRGCLLT